MRRNNVQLYKEKCKFQIAKSIKAAKDKATTNFQRGAGKRGHQLCEVDVNWWRKDRGSYKCCGLCRRELRDINKDKSKCHAFVWNDSMPASEWLPSAHGWKRMVDAGNEDAMRKALRMSEEEAEARNAKINQEANEDEGI